MNKEIKEILEGLEFELQFQTGGCYNRMKVLNNKIKDYITNLEEENEIVHKDFEELSQRYFFTKSKIEKAVEYLKEMDTQLEVYGDYDILSDNKNDLLNILNGRSDE